jgi:hypothetical protein
LFPNFLPILPRIWSSPGHKLISHYPQCKVVCGVGVILPTDDLRRHVSGGPGGVLVVVGAQVTGDAEVGDAEVA